MCRLKGLMYGLKQLPRQWYKRVDSFMISYDFVRRSYDSCVYLKKRENSFLLYLLLYVDSVLVACDTLFEVENLRQLLSSEFHMKDLGEAKKIHGMEIIRDRSKGVLYLSQRKYIEKVMKHFSMGDVKGVFNPLASHFKLSKKLCQKKAKEEQMVRISYTSAVGSVMYAMVCSRPNIANAVSLVSRYMFNMGKGHWEELKWLLRYLKCTSNVCLMFGKDSSMLTRFCNSNSEGDLNARKSTSGFVFTLSGSAISWQSSLQDVVALSTTEAKYIAVVESFKEAKWLKSLVGEMCNKVCSVVHYESQIAIHLARNQNTFHRRSKHMISNIISSGMKLSTKEWV